MNKIIEKQFKLSEDKTLRELIIKEFGNNSNECLNHNYGYLIYADSEAKQVFSAKLSSCLKSDTNSYVFAELTEKINIKSYNEVLLLLTTYFENRKIIENFDNYGENGNRDLDMFLYETKGWLIYHYQMEKLYAMAVNSSNEESITFRKNINKKSVSAFKEAEKIKIFGTGLNNIISERMKFNFTFSPPYHSAYKLYEFLNSNN